MGGELREHVLRGLMFSRPACRQMRSLSGILPRPQVRIRIKRPADGQFCLREMARRLIDSKKPAVGRNPKSVIKVVLQKKKKEKKKSFRGHDREKQREEDIYFALATSSRLPVLPDFMWLPESGTANKTNANLRFPAHMV